VKEVKTVAIAERKFSDFFDITDRFEASDVIYKDGYFYVVFDNLYQIAKIRADLDPQKTGNKLLGKTGDGPSGYEGITFDEESKRFYALVECAEYSDFKYRGKVHEYNSNFERRTGEWWLDFDFKKDANKGFEGLSWVKRRGKQYLLAVCEGNNCAGGKKGTERGNGRIQVFEKKNKNWDHVAVLPIPSRVDFADYTGLGVRGNRVFVTSQESSSLWIGILSDEAWMFENEGSIYHFPSNDGSPLYCNIEGVSEAPQQNGLACFVAVSDKRKKGQKKKQCSSKDQSIHIFREA